MRSGAPFRVSLDPDPRRRDPFNSPFCRSVVVAWTLVMLLSPVIQAQPYDSFLEPNQVIDLSSPYRDRLDKIRVTDGDPVEKGQVLAEIGVSVLKAQLARAKAAAAFHGEVDAARSQVSMRQNRLALLEKLSQSGNTRPQELIVARTDLAVAEAELQSALETQRLRQLELEIVQAQLNDRILKSPIDGVVLKVYKQEAELVGGGDAQPLMTLVQLDPLRAVFHLSPDQGLQMRDTAQREVQVNAQAIPATVTHVSPIINPQSGTVEIHLELPNPDNRLVAGSRCTLGSWK
ncbi:MAG: efflux RND transporter periplasmic adaptor subunit [Desulfobacterales bacterium]